MARRRSVIRRKRALLVESLESRRLMAVLQSPPIPADVDRDGLVAANDALVVINAIASRGSQRFGNTAPTVEADGRLDVNGDGRIDPTDALAVLNRVRDVSFDWARGGMEGESKGLVSGPDLGGVVKPAAVYEATFAAADLALGGLLTAADVKTLLDRASAASQSTDAIIAVVDRGGRILGVRVEGGVSAALQADADRLAFAVDGAVAKARTAAFFSNNQAPLTSRTIRFISQSTVTQREVEASPLNADPRFRGPGFVAPVGVGGQFPPGVRNTPQVDLLGIERQSRDSQFQAGADGDILTGADNFVLGSRFNVDLGFVPAAAQDFLKLWPESYGVASGMSPDGRSRGIATLPGGVPLYKKVGSGVNLVGGIGVFFPGDDGFATHEQGFRHSSELGGKPQTELSRLNTDKVLEAEFMALAAAAGGGIVGRSEFVRNVGDINAKLPPLPNFVALNGRIDLVGITLEIYGPTPSRAFRMPGIDRLLAFGRARIGNVAIPSGVDLPVTSGGDLQLDGRAVPEGWLVAPHDSLVAGELTEAEVVSMIEAGVARAEKTRAAIRLNQNFLPGTQTRMVLAVTDTQGNVLGLFRMPDATVFSIDVAVAKARNTSYYADAAALQPVDRIDFNGNGLFEQVSTSFRQPGDTVPLGTALTNRTFRFLAGPRYPTLAELPKPRGTLDPAIPLADQRPDLARLVGPFSSLRMAGINPYTAENLDPLSPTAIDQYFTANPDDVTAMFFDAFVPSRNFRDPGDAGVVISGTVDAQPLANQNGVVFFPGSTSLYRDGQLRGGLGVSGDGVDQDDVVTADAQQGFEPIASLRADKFIVGGVRLPYQKFNRVPGL